MKEQMEDRYFDPADYILSSENIFTATQDLPVSGFIAVKGNRIIKVGRQSEMKNWIGKNTVVYDLADKLITPGYVDNHTFFAGNILEGLGVDLSSAKSENDTIQLLKDYAASLPEGSCVYGHNWNMSVQENKTPGPEILDKEFPNQPVAIFAKGRENCWLNTCALKRYKFDRTALNFESLWRLVKEYLSDKEFAKQEFRKFMKMMNSKGITSVKDVGFDDFYGFLPVLSEMDKDKELTLRENFVFQAVEKNFDFEFAAEVKNTYCSDFVKFQGFNIMTDGSIGGLGADLIEPYVCNPSVHTLHPVNYSEIEQTVLKADKLGFRVALHAQGDMAVRRCVDMFEKCCEVNGKRDIRHAITCLEVTDPADLERMGKLGIVAEDYPQVISWYGEDIKKIADDTLTKERQANIWNHRKMLDSGVTLSFATDLPLIIPDIPNSIYGVAGKLLPSGERFQEQNALTISEVLKAWSYGGQYNNLAENDLGTLEDGKLADIVVLDQNVFTTPMELMNNVKVYMTISDGRIVYQKDLN